MIYVQICIKRYVWAQNLTQFSLFRTCNLRKKIFRFCCIRFVLRLWKKLKQWYGIKYLFILLVNLNNTNVEFKSVPACNLSKKVWFCLSIAWICLKIKWKCKIKWNLPPSLLVKLAKWLGDRDTFFCPYIYSMLFIH